MVKTRTDENDLGYFDKHPAPMYEAMASLNPAENINHTTPYYGPFLYALARIIGAHNILEIGVAQGWSSGFLSWAVKENNTRYGMNGRYYGLDIDDKSDLQKTHDEIGLPSTFIKNVEGSVDWLENKSKFGPEEFDLIFNDGWHNTKYVVRETELCYPLLKGNGNGYYVMHDVYAWCEEAYQIVLNDPRYKWESVRFLPNYGMAILRKMDDYDHSKIFWPDGDQKEEEGFIH